MNVNLDILEEMKDLMDEANEDSLSIFPAKSPNLNPEKSELSGGKPSNLKKQHSPSSMVSPEIGPMAPKPQESAIKRTNLQKLIQAAQTIDQQNEEEKEAQKGKFNVKSFTEKNMGLVQAQKKRLYDSKVINKIYNQIQKAIPSSSSSRKTSHSDDFFDPRREQDKAMARGEILKLKEKKETDPRNPLLLYQPEKPDEEILQEIIEASDVERQSVKNRASFLISSQKKKSNFKFKDALSIREKEKIEKYEYSDELLRNKLIRNTEKKGRRIGAFSMSLRSTKQVFSPKQSIYGLQPQHTGSARLMVEKGPNPSSFRLRSSTINPTPSSLAPNSDGKELTGSKKLSAKVREMMAMKKITDAITMEVSKKPEKNRKLLEKKLGFASKDNNDLKDKMVKTAKAIYYNNQSVNSIKQIKSGNYEELPFVDEVKLKIKEAEKELLLKAQETSKRLDRTLKNAQAVDKVLRAKRKKRTDEDLKRLYGIKPQGTNGPMDPKDGLDLSASPNREKNLSPSTQKPALSSAFKFCRTNSIQNSGPTLKGNSQGEENSSPNLLSVRSKTSPLKLRLKSLAPIQLGREPGTPLDLALPLPSPEHSPLKASTGRGTKGFTIRRMTTMNMEEEGKDLEQMGVNSSRHLGLSRTATVCFNLPAQEAPINSPLSKSRSRLMSPSKKSQPTTEKAWFRKEVSMMIQDIGQYSHFSKLLNGCYQRHSKDYQKRSFPKDLTYEEIFREYLTIPEEKEVMEKAHKIYLMAGPLMRKEILRKSTGSGGKVNDGIMRLCSGVTVQYHS